MKHNKVVLMTLSLLLISLVFAPSVFADNSVNMSEEIKNQVLNQFDMRKEQLNIDKEHFGLYEESFNDSSLGDPIAYYSISSNYLIGNSTEPLIFEGYILPIRVGDKGAGIVQVKETDGNWKIVQISSYLEYEKDNEDVEDNHDIQTNGNKYIYDEKFHLRGFVTPIVSSQLNEYNFIPTADNDLFGISKNESIALTEILVAAEAIERNADPEELGGLVTGDPYVYKPWLIIAGIILIIGICIFVKRTVPRVR